MPPLILGAWAVGLACLLGLIIEAHRPEEARWPWVRVVLSVLGAAALILVTVGDWRVLPFVALNVVLALVTWWVFGSRFWWAWIVALVALLVVSKLPGVVGTASPDNPLQASRGLWLGFSYLVFRLIHVTADGHAGRLKDATLAEMLTYTLHPASIVSGPIDRLRPSSKAQRTVRPLRESLNIGLWRILQGVFVKFAIANPLFTFIAFNDMARDPDRPIWIAWLWLFAYALYILADFAAYSDIAIGFGHLMGLNLPENFNNPYLSPSPTVFWQRWHMSLSFWVRDYIFFPVVRALRTRYPDDRYKPAIQFVGHMTTMGAVGLWHGLTGNFLVWGLYHGLGLFLHQQFARKPKPRKQWQRADHIRHGLSVAANTLFVAISFVFFAADLPTALRILGRLFGVA